MGFQQGITVISGIQEQKKVDHVYPKFSGNLTEQIQDTETAIKENKCKKKTKANKKDKLGDNL